VWDLFYEADKVREMLTRLIQEEALRTYLFTYSHVYDSISMPTLAQMFELEKPVVHSIISKMIINEELMVNLCTTFLLDLKRTTVKSLLC
jgi:translation initiation factor 3 subunit C